MESSGHDVIELLTADHREVEALFTELETLMDTRGGTGDQLRRDLVDRVTIELVRHSVAEEVVVYPAVKDKVSAEEADRARREHAEAEETMKRLENLDPDQDTFDEELRRLMTEIRKHVDEEENSTFPHMREVMSSEELLELGRRVEAIKKMAPTRPHPEVPNTPGIQLAAGPVAGLFDRLRDMASGRGRNA